jgi:streptomycin 3"-adenylyltransferase
VAVIEEYLADLTRRLEDMLGESLVGVYLHGSLVLGDFSAMRSDVDVLAVVKRPLSPSKKDAIAEVARSHPGLELHVVHQCTIAPVEAPPFELHAGSGKVVDGAGHPGDTDLPMHFAVLREHGRALRGPPPAIVFPPVPRALLLRSFAGELRWAEEHASPSYQVLNACRALRFLEEGVLCSKLEGAEWARARGLRRGLVDAAVRHRRGLTEAQPSAGPAVELLREVRARLETATTTGVEGPCEPR